MKGNKIAINLVVRSVQHGFYETRSYWLLIPALPRGVFWLFHINLGLDFMQIHGEYALLNAGPEMPLIKVGLCVSNERIEVRIIDKVTTMI